MATEIEANAVCVRCEQDAIVAANHGNRIWVSEATGIVDGDIVDISDWSAPEALGWARKQFGN